MSRGGDPVGVGDHGGRSLRCRRCNGNLVEDEGDLRCIHCGRAHHQRAGPMTTQKPKTERFIQCRGCRVMIRLHGPRTRCRSCQLDDLARRAREKRVIPERRCLVCKKVMAVGRMSKRGFCPGECYGKHRRVLSARYRWEKRHGYVATVPKSISEGCPCPKH